MASPHARGSLRVELADRRIAEEHSLAEAAMDAEFAGFGFELELGKGELNDSGASSSPLRDSRRRRDGAVTRR
jgi:hypothetical protein